MVIKGIVMLVHIGIYVKIKISHFKTLKSTTNGLERNIILPKL
jgi:hypothetical protein